MPDPHVQELLDGLAAARDEFLAALADIDPAMADLKPMAAESLARALATIDQLWTADQNAA